MGGFNPAWFIATGIGVLMSLVTASSISPQQKLWVRVIGGFFIAVGILGLGWDFHSMYELRLPFAARQMGEATGHIQFPKWPDPYRPISIIGETFTNKQVVLDGHSYQHCTFENVTFVYNGTTPPAFNNNVFRGTPVLRSENPVVDGTVAVLKGLGYLQPGSEIRGLSPSNRVEEPERPHR